MKEKILTNYSDEESVPFRSMEIEKISTGEKTIGSYSIQILDEMNYDWVFESKWKIAGQSLRMCAEFTIITLLYISRDVTVFLFTRSKGVEVAEALTAFSLAYTLFSFALPWSFSTLYMFQAAESFAAQNYVLVGKYTNKMNFLMICFGVIIIIFLSVVVPIVFDKMSSSPGAVEHLAAMSRWYCIAIIPLFISFTYMRLFPCINKLMIYIVILVQGCLAQMGLNFLLISNLEMIDFGIAWGFNVAVITNLIAFIGYFYYWKPVEQAIIPFWEGIFEDFWTFLIDSINVGTTIFLCYFSLNFLPYFSLILGDTSYTIVNMMVLLISMICLVSECLSIGNNILINYLIGKKRYETIVEVLLVNLSINLIYIVLVEVAFLSLFHRIISIFSSEDWILDIADSQKIPFFFASLFTNFHNILSETTIILGGKNFALISTAIGRFGLGLVLSLTLIFTNFGLSSILLGYTVGQLVTLIMNASYLLTLFSNNKKNLYITLLEISDFYEIQKRISDEADQKKKNKKERQNMGLV